MRYIRNESTDPTYNLALEEWVLENLRDDTYVMLWRNAHAIIVGRNQNTAAEVNARYVEEQGIRVVRRETGGGAVYHDLGNLNFSIISDAQEMKELDFAFFTLPVKEALKEMGINADSSGRNDLTIDGKKFSGIAQRQHRGRVLNHGTLLFDTDLSVLGASLNPRNEKIASKGVKSVAARVTNIRPYMKTETDILEFRDLLLEEMFRKVGGVQERVLTEEELEGVRELQEQKYATSEWNYGRSPRAQIKNYQYFPGIGGIEAQLSLEANRITSARFFGDFFAPEKKEVLEEHLEGQVYLPSQIREAIENIDIQRYLGKITNTQLIELLFADREEE